MSVIIFQLMNNYYQDKLSEKRGTDTLYSTFGYFDGLSINMPEISENINNLGHKQDVEFNININRLIVSEYNADCNCRNLVCYTDDEEKNETFWKGSRKALYLFISLVRIEQYTGIETFVQDINKRDNVF